METVTNNPHMPTVERALAEARTYTPPVTFTEAERMAFVVAEALDAIPPGKKITDLEKEIKFFAKTLPELGTRHPDHVQVQVGDRIVTFHNEEQMWAKAEEGVEGYIERIVYDELTTTLLGDLSSHFDVADAVSDVIQNADDLHDLNEIMETDVEYNRHIVACGSQRYEYFVSVEDA